MYQISLKDTEKGNGLWISETDFWFGFVFSECLRTGILHLSENLLFMARVIGMQLIGCSSIYSMWGFFDIYSE